MTPEQKQAVVDAARNHLFDTLPNSDADITAAIVAALRELAKQQDRDFEGQNARNFLTMTADELEGK